MSGCTHVARGRRGARGLTRHAQLRVAVGEVALDGADAQHERVGDRIVGQPLGDQLEGRNHVLLETEPAWAEFLSSVDEFLGVSPAAPAPPEDWDLSAREEQVLGLVADGLSNEAIADELVLSVRTVERHLSNSYAKLRVSGKAARAAAAARYVRATRHPVR